MMDEKMYKCEDYIQVYPHIFIFDTAFFLNLQCPRKKKKKNTVCNINYLPRKLYTNFNSKTKI